MTIDNFEAEASVLGSVLLDGTRFSQLSLTEEQFAFKEHKRIFQAMIHMSENNQTIDLVTVTTNLGDALTDIGGVSYLSQLAESVPSLESMPHYERLVFEAYRNRKSRELAIKYAEQPNENKLAQLIESLQSCQGLGGSKEEKDTNDYLLEITEAMLSGDSGSTGLATSFVDLDQMTGGLQPGEMIIVAARPSVGKTAFALNLAAAHCRNKGMSSVFSLEMGTKQLLQRMISAEGYIHSQKWRSMVFNRDDYLRALAAVGEISNWRLSLHEHHRTISDICASLRKAVRDYPDEKHLAIIDYLQLIRPTNKRERRDLEVGEMTRELKLLAVELNIPIVLLSQLSRGVEQRHDKRPLMSDLRESGNIEQDADIISFLYREDYYDKETNNTDIIEIIIAKQRNGPTGTVELLLKKEYGRFENVG
ncbi:replicative DNA helicase [Aquibacillus salsiterrae]|uniref:Replicative DNA helicase n=1 Tax=Aquibacillus salsiterrae TaxID=2950439 RepID=A0A9X3WJ85_9BACI|nr:replicative DNA helicase [Aquibacillus salsiterrae]MDC3418066.1 replicative DNA helicase [Aquibacillus salsiterrae]